MLNLARLRASRCKTIRKKYKNEARAMVVTESEGQIKLYRRSFKRDYLPFKILEKIHLKF